MNRPAFRPEYFNEQIWNTIASYCSQQTLRQLSVVHRLLIRPARIHLFRKLDFRNYVTNRHREIRGYDQVEPCYWYKGRSTTQLALVCERFQKILTSGLAAYVRHWHFEGMLPVSPLQGSDLGNHHGPGGLLLQRFLHLLGSYPSLISLQLVKVFIAEAEITLIAALKTIHKLEFRQVLFLSPLQIHRPLQLEEFALIERYPYGSPPPAAVFHPQYLRRLILHASCNSLMCHHIFQATSINAPYAQLAELDVKVTQMTLNLFVQFLDHCPVLSKLTVSFVDKHVFADIKFATVDLNPSACPELREFKGPLGLALRLVPGRLVEKVAMYGYKGSEILTEAMDLQHMTISMEALSGHIIRELHLYKMRLDYARELLPLLKEYFPMLLVLRVELWDLYYYNSRDNHYVKESIEYPGKYTEEGKSAGHPDDSATLQRELYWSCFDAHMPNCNLLDFIPQLSVNGGLDDPLGLYMKGYPRFLAFLATGLIKLPHHLENLEIILSRQFKNHAFTKYHEHGLVIGFSKNHSLPHLRFLSIGIEHGYNYGWCKENTGIGEETLWIKRGTWKDDKRSVERLYGPKPCFGYCGDPRSLPHRHFEYVLITETEDGKKDGLRMLC